MNKKFLLKISFLVAGLAMVALISFLGTPNVKSPIPVSAASSCPSTTGSGNVYGWLWSENIGWVSLNCCNTNSCSQSSYGVDVNPTTGNMTGFAWSENIGWIKFGGLSGFPTGGGTSAVNTKMNSDGTFTGWFRTCSATVNGDCDSATIAGGWDGWISMRGTGYGVYLDTSVSPPKIRGYAWGSDVNGWFDFNAYGEGGVPNDDGPTLGGISPSVSLYAQDPEDNQWVKNVTMVKSESSALKWSSSEVVSCTASGDWSGNKTANVADRTQNLGQLNQLGSYTYTLTCSDSIGGTSSDTAHITVVEEGAAGDVSCSASPTNVNTTEPVEWTANCDGGACLGYLWEGEGISPGATGESVTVSYGTAGVKTAKVSIDEGSTYTTCATTVKVNIKPNWTDF